MVDLNGALCLNTFLSLIKNKFKKGREVLFGYTLYNSVRILGRLGVIMSSDTIFPRNRIFSLLVT